MNTTRCQETLYPVMRKLGGIDPSQNVREQLQAPASGAFELKLMHKGKSTKVTVENAMYVPGIEVHWSRRGIWGKRDLMCAKEIGAGPCR